jgi:hypothetical protein
VARYFADWPFAEVDAGCFDECRLQVSISDPRQPEYFAGYASGKVARPHDPRAWVSAAARLRVEDQFGGAAFGSSGSSHPPPVQFGLAQGIGPWVSPVEDVSFMAAEGLAAACAHPDPLAGFTYHVRASEDARGRVSRCLATSDHSLVRPDDAACVCGSLEALEIPSGRPGRRFHVEATDHGGFGAVGASLELVQPGTEPWRRRVEESLALARCMAAGVPPGGFEGVITLSLAPDGGVHDVRIDGDITTPPAMEMASCLVQELRLVPLPCRPPGIDALQLRLAIKNP